MTNLNRETNRVTTFPFPFPNRSKKPLNRAIPNPKVVRITPNQVNGIHHKPGSYQETGKGA